ncbi:MAG: PIG-L family deacetylase, partial [bacterium]
MKAFLFKILFLIFSVCTLTDSLLEELVAQNKAGFLTDQGYLALYQAITDLKCDYTLMSVAAHPDDEDIETLTYYRRKQGVKTIVVAATRGEGGQNEIGPELYRDLGVIRTYEMWRAGAISGTEYYNLNLEEFGYSKSSQETFEKWGHEEPLRRLLHLIRKLRPDVIITNHDTKSGHGNHQAVGILIREAFDMAGDSTKFPEQLKHGISIWQPKRLFQRLSLPEGADVSVPVGDYDPIRGESYAQMAARALSEHRSQGMEFFAKKIQRGPRYTYYKVVMSAEGSIPKGVDLFEGISDIFEKLNLTDFETVKINQLKIARLKTLAVFFETPTALKSNLLEELKLWRKFEADFSKNSEGISVFREQEKKLELALSHALNLEFDLHLSDKKVIRNQKIEIKTVFFNGGWEGVVLKSVRLIPRNDWFGKSFEYFSQPLTKKLQYNQSDTVTFELLIPEGSKFTVPKTEVFYQTDHWQPLVKAMAEYEYQGVKLHVWAEADFEIVPGLDLKLESPKTIIPLSFRGQRRDFVVQIQNNSPDSVSGEIKIEWGESNHKTNSIERFALVREDEATSVQFTLPIPVNLSPGDYSIQATAHFFDSHESGKTFFKEGTLRVIDVATAPDLKVGIVKSYDNTLQNALEQLGIASQLLTSEDLQWADLSQFDAIVLDIRAYLVRQDLRKNNTRILEYVRNGVNLIVMYHKVFEWNPEYGNPRWSPYPLIL